MRPRRALPAVVLAAALTGCATQGQDLFTDTARRASGTGVDVTQARQQLAGLAVQPEGSSAGYSREKFPHWSTVSGACNTRETVLRDQGQDVRTDAMCRPISGTWHSPYDGATWTKASDVDIDHVVPLAEAWRSGASAWTTARRQAFANDLDHPQLIAVTDNLNQAKADQDPSTWQPPLRSYRCAYAGMWIEVKAYYRLTADPAEVSALRRMLDTCH